MFTEKRKKIFLKRRRFYIFISTGILLGLVVLIFVYIGCFREKSHEAGEKGLIETLESYQGYIRTVGTEEYDFYSGLVRRNLPEETDEEEAEEKIRAYINEVNAVFYLGNRLELCEPYSFELLKLRMEQENDARKIKLEKGEAVYGLQQFQLETYVQYVLDNLETGIITYIEVNADDEIVSNAGEYYDANRELFRFRKSVTYETEEGGVTEEQTAEREQMNFLGKSDKELADFLETADVGDVFERGQGEEHQRFVLTDIRYGEKNFEEDQDIIVSYYIQSELYPALIKIIAGNNPVEFK